MPESQVESAVVTQEDVKFVLDSYNKQLERLHRQEEIRQGLNSEIAVHKSNHERLQKEAVDEFGTCDPSELNKMATQWHEDNKKTLEELTMMLDAQEAQIKATKDQLSLA